MTARSLPIGRRGFIAGAAAGLVTARSALAGPAIITGDASRPGIPSGVQTGDPTGDRCMLWCRSDRPARMMVEWATNERFTGAVAIDGPLVLQDSDFTGRLDLTALPPGADVFYRVRFQDATDVNVFSEPLTGRFRTPGTERRNLSFCFSGDETGQGWGIDPAFGGLKMYDTMLAFAPDFFIHSGDQIYADQPLPTEVKLADGKVWKNIVTPAKAKVAETLTEFRGNYAYNLTDENKRRFLAEVPLLVQWDDHDVKNNWFPGQIHDDSRYKVKSVSLLSAYARRAMFDYNAFRILGEDPERTYRTVPYGPSLDVFMTDVRSQRGPNTRNRQGEPGNASAFFGPAQLAWLKRGLKESKAVWKVVACSLPISYVNDDYNAYMPKGTFEGWANRDDGAPLGRELELADLLSFIKENRIRNVVWVSADVHFAASIRHEPSRAGFTEFDPFWEFIAGPMHAGTYGPSTLDLTFGPDVRYLSVRADLAQNRPPTEGLQFFGHAAIDGQTDVMTVRLHDITGKELNRTVIEPEV